MNAVRSDTNERGKHVAAGGWTAWLLERLRSRQRPPSRLALLERITLAPRQSLALIEAEGRRLLVATSPDGAPAFYALDGGPQPVSHRARHGEQSCGRVSW